MTMISCAYTMEAMVNLADLELRHLSALRAVAETGTFGKAATKLGFSQSAVSQQIASLERIVGASMFERHGGPRPVTLTPAGELLLPHAVSILDRVRVTEADLAGFLAGEIGTLRVGTFQSVSVRILPDLLTELGEEHPGIEIRLFESDDQDVLLNRLRSGELDLTFAVLPLTAADDLTVDVLCQDPFVALAPLDSKILPPEGPIGIRDFDGLPIIGQPRTSCQLVIEEGFRKAGVEPDVVFRSTDNGAVQAMVRAGMGHAVLARLAVDLDDKNVAIRPLDPPMDPRTIVLVRVSDRHLPHSERVLRDLAAKHTAGITAD